MQTLGIIVVLAVGFFVLRFFLRTKQMANTANEVINTANKFKMTREMVRQKAGALATPGRVTPERQTYIAYLYEIAAAMSLADNLPETMCQAFVMEEARYIFELPEEADSKALMQECIASPAGAVGTRMGKIDGKKVADRNASRPFFVEFDSWVAERLADSQ